MYKEVRELTLPREAMVKPHFIMALENISNYIRNDYLNSVDESTVYTSLKIGIVNTDISVRKVASPYAQHQKYRERGDACGTVNQSGQ